MKDVTCIKHEDIVRDGAAHLEQGRELCIAKGIVFTLDYPAMDVVGMDDIQVERVVSIGLDDFAHTIRILDFGFRRDNRLVLNHDHLDRLVGTEIFVDECLEVLCKHVHDSRRIGYGDLLRERHHERAGRGHVIIDAGKDVGMPWEGICEERIDVRLGYEVGIAYESGSRNCIICQGVSIERETACLPYDDRSRSLLLCGSLLDGRSRCRGLFDWASTSATRTAEMRDFWRFT